MLESYEVRQNGKAMTAMDAHAHGHESENDHDHVNERHDAQQQQQHYKMLSTSQQVPHNAEDEKIAWKLYHQVNGLRKRSRNNMDTHTDEVEEARPKASKQSKASKPLMVFHQGTQLWYRAKVSARQGDDVQILWDGKDNWPPVWIAYSSPLIWKGSLKAKDWKHVQAGGWEPKGKTSGKGKFSPTTPPLSRSLEGSLDLSESEESTDSKKRKLKIVKIENIAHIAKLENMRKRHNMPIKLLLKKAFNNK